MPSTNKTPILGLNLYEPSDKPKMVDTNTDNQTLDDFAKYAQSLLSVLPGNNLLINGSLKINQRGTTITNPSNAYLFDRMRVNGTGTVSKDANGMAITGAINLKYVMEPEDFKFISGKVVTLSYSKGGVISTLTYTASSATVVDLALTTGIYNWFKLELGAAPTLFYPKSVGEELFLCQRYYYKITGQPYTRAGFAIGSFSNTLAYAQVPIAATMRTFTPAITFSNLFISNSTISEKIDTISSDPASRPGLMSIAVRTLSTKINVGVMYEITAVNDSTAFLAFDCEL